MKTNHKPDIVREYAHNLGATMDIADQCMDAFTKTITDMLLRREKVMIPSFLTLFVKERHARQSSNPRDPNKIVNIPAIDIVRIKTGIGLRKSIYDSKGKPFPPSPVEHIKKIVSENNGQ